MDPDYISRKEFEAYGEKCDVEHRRLDEENARQNKRIGTLEETFRQLNVLTVSVKEMAVNMSNMLEEQKKQGLRLESLEKEPRDAYKQIKATIATAVITAIVGAIVGAVLVLL